MFYVIASKTINSKISTTVKSFMVIFFGLTNPWFNFLIFQAFFDYTRKAPVMMLLSSVVVDCMIAISSSVAPVSRYNSVPVTPATPELPK